ncbi:dTDP-4-dehydrorhamnose reductase [Aerolutibacter ruishenii]|uniref:dTDP-4-dehydrorhamnose reductase n=1 Tax=Aerolutibacter ruishenii TaxID=686800 RepID=A0A562M2S4_9GAMM|nr:dTDP-4-dehydrorhamnose reductase [Lysobacter ruishenii]TWI14245.1 dTDP-4-dehydrorhamnose reductase [Lysobacter ruishenii]
MRILLIGGNGQVGHALRHRLAPLGQVVVTTRSGALPDGSRCDVLDLSVPGEAARAVRRLAPGIVVNAAAWTAVDKAENERDAAFRANAGAVGEIAQACAERDVPLVHYSTDYVFDGSASRPYLPQDPTAPLGVYGASKLAGEQAIRDSGVRHLILRTAWVYGLHGHNFLRTMLRLGAEREELRVVADQVGGPTPAWLIADVTTSILQQGVQEGGTHHLVADGQTSWHGFAEAIFDEALALGLLSRRPRVVPISTADYPTPAARPAWSVLDTRSLRQQWKVVLPDWREALNRTLRVRDAA